MNTAIKTPMFRMALGLNLSALKNALVLFRRFLVTVALATTVVSTAGVAQAATYTEDFEAAFPAWESDWLGTNSDLKNFYCSGGSGCSDRGNNPDGLWAWGTGQIIVTFESGFGATLTSLSLDVAGFNPTSLLAYDIDNNLIFNTSVALTEGAFTDPGTYSNYTITSGNGIGSFKFDSFGASGNTSIDNVVAITTVTPVPEPEIYAMMGLGLGLMGWVARRRKALAA